jgi:hypothetical protein
MIQTIEIRVFQIDLKLYNTEMLYTSLITDMNLVILKCISALYAVLLFSIYCFEN